MYTPFGFYPDTQKCVMFSDGGWMGVDYSTYDCTLNRNTLVAHKHRDIKAYSTSAISRHIPIVASKEGIFSLKKSCSPYIASQLCSLKFCLIFLKVRMAQYG